MRLPVDPYHVPAQALCKKSLLYTRELKVADELASRAVCVVYSTTLYLSTHPHSHCTICLRPSAVVMACGQRQNLVRIAYRDLATALPGHTPRRMVQLRSSLNLKQLSTCTYCRSEPLLPEINRAAEQQKTFEGFPLFFFFPQGILPASCLHSSPLAFLFAGQYVCSVHHQPKPGPLFPKVLPGELDLEVLDLSFILLEQYGVVMEHCPLYTRADTSVALCITCCWSGSNISIDAPFVSDF